MIHGLRGPIVFFWFTLLHLPFLSFILHRFEPQLHDFRINVVHAVKLELC